MKFDRCRSVILLLVLGLATSAGAAPPDEPQATDPASMKVAKGFRVERLYTVPKDTQGSWVNMAVDPKGRLTVSDQYGQLYTVTVPAVGKTGEVKVEPIDVPIGEAQGLLWAFDSLYVVVNRGQKYESGLYRVRDTDGDGKLDKVDQLRKLNGGGEHGPHAIIPSADGKSLYLVAGNGTKLTDLAGSHVPQIWEGDHLLPPMPDGNGFMRGVPPPGGCIYKLDPEGKEWTLISMGYRNPFDIALNKSGDVFTYDADMEWDMNTPWYRPTRVCMAADGSEFGWRNGAGKWPAYYPDSLPPVVNIGPGSPTGITFGYGAKFPAAYQNSLFICDWSYGKLYAVHIEPDQSAYKGTLEEFVTGTPLPLTDLVINPTDGAMYFAIGGRKTLSGLYRVTYVGPDSTEPAAPVVDAEARSLRTIRHSLESFHGESDPDAVAESWPYLGHSDRFLRFAARVALEFQDPKTWQDKALSEQDPAAALTALLALTRVGDRSLQPRVLEALDQIKWEDLKVSQRIDLLRVYSLAFIRMGKPDDATRKKVIARFDPVYPSKSRELNAELAKMLIYLEAPSAAAKTVALLEKAPTQEEQIQYAMDLRNLTTGWTPDLREKYFSWFLKAANYKGGSSFSKFVLNIKNDALATLSDAEKTALKPILDAEPVRTTVASQPARPFVKEYTLDELIPIVQKGLATPRDFDRGRSLFAATNCFACHRYDNEGGAVGPDLTGVSGRFSPRDLLESIVQPSKTISDQYQAVTIATSDGKVVSGRIVNLHGDNLMVMTNMLDPNGQVSIDQRKVEEMRPSDVSMMPEGLLNTLSESEIQDLMAYLLSGGNRDAVVFQKKSAGGGQE